MRWMAVLIWRLPPRSSRCRLVLPELTGIGAMPPARASLASLENRATPAISPMSLPAVNGPKPGSASSCGATCSTMGDLGLQGIDRGPELAQVPQLVAGDANPRGLLGPREPARDLGRPLL